jgi:hypothetical protein
MGWSGLMLHVFGCSDVSTPRTSAHSQSLFQTGWFVENLLTQTLVIHVIRTNKLPPPRIKTTSPAPSRTCPRSADVRSQQVPR